MSRLDIGDTFPRLDGVLADGAPFQVPEDLGNQRAVLLFYRGHW